MIEKGLILTVTTRRYRARDDEIKTKVYAECGTNLAYSEALDTFVSRISNEPKPGQEKKTSEIYISPSDKASSSVR